MKTKMNRIILIGTAAVLIMFIFLNFSSPTKKQEKTAYKIYTYLMKFPFKDNDHHYRPEDVEKNGTMDCDDFSIYAYTLFKKAGIKSKVLLIRKPRYNRVPYHAMIIYKTDRGWMWMDNGDFGKHVEKDWCRLASLRYGRLVWFREIDVESLWLNRGYATREIKLTNREMWIYK